MTAKAELVLVLPAGAMGASPHDTELDSMLRRIALAASKNHDAEWPDKYGTNVDNDVFSMHEFCYCEKPTCPRCMDCSCPPDAVHYLVDGVDVSDDEWMDFYRRTAGDGPKFVNEGAPGHEQYLLEHAEWERRSDAANARRTTHVDEATGCVGCLREQRGEPRGAANFRFKPTGFEVRWYKYIGRSVEVRGEIPDGGIGEIEAACLASVHIEKSTN